MNTKEICRNTDDFCFVWRPSWICERSSFTKIVLLWFSNSLLKMNMISWITTEIMPTMLKIEAVMSVKWPVSNYLFFCFKHRAQPGHLSFIWYLAIKRYNCWYCEIKYRCPGCALCQNKHRRCRKCMIFMKTAVPDTQMHIKNMLFGTYSCSKWSFMSEEGSYYMIRSMELKRDDFHYSMKIFCEGWSHPLFGSLWPFW